AGDRLVEQGRVLDQPARRGTDPPGERLCVHPPRSDEQQVVGSRPVRRPDVERASLRFIDGERQVRPWGEYPGAVPEDGEPSSLVGRDPGEVDGEEVLAAVAIEVGCDDRGDVAFDHERLDLESGGRRCRREEKRQDEHWHSIDRNPSVAEFAANMFRCWGRKGSWKRPTARSTPHELAVYRPP